MPARATFTLIRNRNTPYHKLLRAIRTKRLGRPWSNSKAKLKLAFASALEKTATNVPSVTGRLKRFYIEEARRVRSSRVRETRFAGRTVLSIDMNKRDEYTGAFKYYIPVSEGFPPSGGWRRQPPVAAILTWMRAKGISGGSTVAKRIAKKIMHRGINPQGHLDLVRVNMIDTLGKIGIARAMYADILKSAGLSGTPGRSSSRKLPIIQPIR